MTSPAQQLQEEVLVLKAQMGEERAFLDLVRAYHGKLLYYVRRLVEDQDLAEDVLQDTWLAAWRQLPRLRAAQAFRVWIYRIAHGRAVSRIRGEARYVGMAEDFDVPVEEGVEDEEFDARHAEQVHLALLRLSSAPREALILHFLEDMSHEEIAEVVGVPVGTVKSRIHYGKKAVRREMARMERTDHE